MRRIGLSFLVIFAIGLGGELHHTAAQTGTGTQWQSRGTGQAVPSVGGQAGNSRPAAAGTRIARVTPGADVLPRTAGQVWRNYDISPFTRKYRLEDKPQQEIIDWILRETGTDLWFSEPLGILSASYDTLQVYHTPAVQSVVHDIVDRFVEPTSQSHVVTFQLLLVGNPNWRARAIQVLSPVEVRSDGVQGWLLTKENAALLLADLRRRSDFREVQGPNLFLQSGRTEVLTRTRPVDYISGLQAAGAGMFAAPMNRTIQEGFSLELSALKSADGQHMEAVVKCLVNQVEKLQDVPLDILGPTGQPQRVQIQVPQLVTWRLHERFLWPNNQVLLLSCGVVATPGEPPRGSLIPLPQLVNPGAGRADALLMLEVKPVNEGTLLQTPGATPTATRPGVNSQGRY